jgi:hypothetical protein
MSSQLTGVQLWDIRQTVMTRAWGAEEAITMKQLLKTQQAGKTLSGCCFDLSSVDISGSAVIACSSKWCLSGQYPVMTLLYFKIAKQTQHEKGYSERLFSLGLPIGCGLMASN